MERDCTRFNLMKGKPPPWGSEGREFKSHHSDQRVSENYFKEIVLGHFFAVKEEFEVHGFPSDDTRRKMAEFFG